MGPGETRTWIVIKSMRMDKIFTVEAWREYYIDMDLETDSDQFHIVINNAYGRLTGYFNKFDPIKLYINGVRIMSGFIDEIEYSWDGSEDVIQIIGRDMMAVLVDNDALPQTMENVDRARFIEDQCVEYGIAMFRKNCDLGIQDKLVIGTSESICSICSNILMEDDHRLWYIDDTIYAGNWDMSQPPSYLFTRGLPLDKSGIPIQKFNLKDSGTKLKSESRIYGSTDDGDNKVEGVAKNDALIRQRVRKVRTMRSSKNDTSSKYASSALRKIKQDFRSGIELQITVKTLGWDYGVIEIGKTAQVIDYITKVNSTFFIKGVRYEKSISSGSTTTITMVPDDATFEVLWTNVGTRNKKGQGGARVDSGNDYSYITGTASVTLQELMDNLK